MAALAELNGSVSHFGLAAVMVLLFNFLGASAALAGPVAS